MTSQRVEVVIVQTARKLPIEKGEDVTATIVVTRGNASIHFDCWIPGETADLIERAKAAVGAATAAWEQGRKHP